MVPRCRLSGRLSSKPNPKPNTMGARRGSRLNGLLGSTSTQERSVKNCVHKLTAKSSTHVLQWSYPGLADGLSVAIQSAARATSLEVFSKFIGERYPSAECPQAGLDKGVVFPLVEAAFVVHLPGTGDVGQQPVQAALREGLAASLDAFPGRPAFRPPSPAVDLPDDRDQGLVVQVEVVDRPDPRRFLRVDDQPPAPSSLLKKCIYAKMTVVFPCGLVL